ncbi:MAG: hypothetical protein ABI980_01410 [Nitrospirota bacterium]
MTLQAVHSTQAPSASYEIRSDYCESGTRSEQFWHCGAVLFLAGITHEPASKSLAPTTGLHGTGGQALAAHLHRHCQEIIETLLERLGSNNWEQFHQFGMIGDATRWILLKGFGIPDRRGLSHSRIVLLLSPHTPEPISGMRKMAPRAGTLEAESLHAMGMGCRFFFHSVPR